MRAPLTALAFVIFLAQYTHGEAGRDVTLTLPHALRVGEAAWLEIDVGPLARGDEIDITTTSGRSLGTISPYGIRSGQAAGTYTVPLPADAIAGDRVSLRLTLGQRAPTLDEVKSVRLKISGATR